MSDTEPLIKISAISHCIGKMHQKKRYKNRMIRDERVKDADWYGGKRVVRGGGEPGEGSDVLLLTLMSEFIII